MKLKSKNQKSKIVIVGVGLMGGSLGLALRRRGGWRVVGLSRRRSAVNRARRRGAIHEGTTDPARALSHADVVVFCAPVDQIVPLARRCRRWIPPSALVMDVGSVKGPVVRGMEKLFSGATGPAFIGAHPMAGSEKTGVENARADLYRGAVCALTPTGHTPAAARRRAEHFWRGLGARVLSLDPDAHDRAVALISHLPHLIADALVLAAGRRCSGASSQEILYALAAGSFRDATRVAGADPKLWRGIFSLNAAPLREAAALFQRVFSGLAARRWPLAALREAQKLNAAFRGPRP